MTHSNHTSEAPNGSFLQDVPSQKFEVNPLSSDIKMYILLTVLHTFLMEQVRRI